MLVKPPVLNLNGQISMVNENTTKLRLNLMAAGYDG